MACPNVNSQQWRDLVAKIGTYEAMKEFIKNGEEIPDASLYAETFKGVNATLKIVNALQKVPRTSYPSNSVQGFYNDLIKQGAPKNQIELLKQHISKNNITDINTNDLITSLLSEMSYTVEINAATERKTEGLENNSTTKFFDLGTLSYEMDDYHEDEGGGITYKKYGTVDGKYIEEKITEKEFSDAGKKAGLKQTEYPTQHYSNLTVPGGTNYTENEIATPAIVPSIKGHAQFSTDNGIGWFRSDDSERNMIPNDEEGIKRMNEIDSESIKLSASYNKGEITLDEVKRKKEILNKERAKLDKSRNNNFKTRRILEVQSDLFQKGRDKAILSSEIADRFNNEDNESFENRINKTQSNQFLQLLNKDNNWVTFFVKSIIQDSAKKGYEKVLFPTGNTASKVEGHSTLETYVENTKKAIVDAERYVQYQKDRTLQDIKRSVEFERENGDFGGEQFDNGIEPNYKEIRDNNIAKAEYTLNTRKKELEDALAGRTKFSAINSFYENTITNILKKQGYNPNRITDEYGNQWNEIEITPVIAKQTILFQAPGTEGSKASPKTLHLINQWMERLGIKEKELPQYDLRGRKIDANGRANLLNDVIEIAQGKDDVAKTEEMMHFAVAIMKQTNSTLFKQMMNKIGTFNYYKKIFNEYSKKYVNKDGTPDILKIKEEAIGKILAEYLIKDTEGATEKPELLAQTLSWWQQIKDFFLALIGKATFNPFEIAVKEIDKIEDTKALDAPYKELADRMMEKDIPGIQGVAAKSAYKEGRYRSLVTLFSEQLEDPQTYQTTIDTYLEGDEQLAKDLLQAAQPFLQIAPSDSIFDRIDKKIEDYQLVKRTDTADPDDENNNSFYEITVNGATKKVDRTTEWAKKQNIIRNGGKDYLANATPAQKKIWAQKAMSGTNGHIAIEGIIKNNLNPDGTLKPKEEWRAPESSLVNHDIYVDMNRWLLGYRVPVTGEIKPGFLDQFPAGSKFGVEKMLYNEKAGKDGRASTIDLLVELPDGSVKVYDWKFMGFLLEKPDQAFLKRSQHALQLGDYKTSLREAYGIKKVDAFTIPIHAEYIETASDVKLKSVTFGNVNFKNETRTSMLPVTPAGQSSGNKQVDQLIASLEAHYKKIYNRKEDPYTKYQKIEQLQQLSNAIRNLQAALNFDPLAASLENFISGSKKVLDKYAELDFTGIDEEALTKQLDELLEVFHSAETFAGIDEVFRSEYKGELSKENERVLSKLSVGATASSGLKDRALNILQKYVSYIAQKEGVDNILSPTKEVKGMLNTMLERGSILSPMANLAVQRLLDKRSVDKQIVSKEIHHFGELYSALEKLASSKGKKVFQLIGDGNQLIKKVKKEFWTSLGDAFEKQNKKFILDNINQEAFNKELEEEINKRQEIINDTIYTTDVEENTERRKYYSRVLLETLNLYGDKFKGWNDRSFQSMVKRHVVEEPHWTIEYKELHKEENAPSLAMHSYLYELNRKAFQTGYLGNGNTMSFFPLVTGTIFERLAQASNTGSTLVDVLKDPFVIDASQRQAYGATNPETGELEKAVPKLFTRTNREDEALSKDLLKVIPLYIRALQEYSTSKDLEMEMLTYELVERAKGHLEEEAGHVIFDAEGPKEFKGNENNANILKDLLDYNVYGIRESSNTLFDRAASKLAKGTEEEKKQKVVSAKKTLTQGNALTQSLAVGLKALVAIPNYFGGNMQAFVNAGLYYPKGDFVKNQGKILTGALIGKSANIDKGLIDLIVPLNDDVVKEGQRHIAGKQSPAKWLGTWTFQEFMMSTNQYPDKLLQLSNAKSFNDNSMVVNGDIVNIKQHLLSLPEYKNRYNNPATIKEKERELNDKIKELRDTVSLPKIAKFNEKGFLEIPGVSQESLAKYRTAVVEYGRKITGQMSQENSAKYRQDILVKSFMMFKNWIPKQVALRTLDIKKNPSLNQWEYGRTRLFIKTISHLGARNILQMRDIITASPRGIEIMKEMVEKKREEYYRKTGLELTITDEEFYDMVRKELSAQMKELAILVSLIGLVVAAKLAAPPDDDDPLSKNKYKFWAKAVNKVSDEMWFYYSPTSAESITRGSIFPSLGLLSKADKVITTAGKDLFGYIQDDEEAMQKAHTLKYFFNMVPIASQFQNELFPIIAPEEAKDWGIISTSAARAYR